MATSVIGETIESTTIENSDYLRSTISLNRSGNVCYLAYASDIKNVPAGEYIDIGTLPVGYRPKSRYIGRITNNTSLIIITLDPSGSIQMYNYGSAIGSSWNNGAFNATYIVK